MLVQFHIKRQFNKLAVSLWVDCDRKTASLLASYERRIIRADEAVEFWKVSTPEMAEKWLTEPQGEMGSRIETLEHITRLGLAA